MPIQFPQNPTEGDQFTSGSNIFVYENDKWKGLSNATAASVTGFPGATGPQGPAVPSNPVIDSINVTGTSTLGNVEISSNYVSNVAGNDISYEGSRDNMYIKSPDGNKWVITISDTGSFTVLAA